MIKLQQIEKYYGSYHALNKISVDIRPNQIVGLLGPNGAGKTTLIRILTCYHFPTQGDAHINDHSVLETPQQVKAQIGYLPENAPLYEEMSIYEYLLFMSKVRNIRPSRIEWVVQNCGLTNRVHQSIATLSKGYRQRVGLAQAILHDPPILILDEPTSGLDPNQIIEIRNLIRELGKKKTVILSTHILQEVEAICDKVLILHKGSLVAQGTTQEIGSQIKGGSGFSLVVKGAADSARIRKSLQGVSAVEQVIQVTPHANTPHLFSVDIRIQGKTATDSGEILFDWAQDNNYKLLRMAESSAKLEDVFAQLTNN